MIVLVIVGLAVLVLFTLATAVGITLRLLARRQMAAQLHDDWWPQFEQAFREYERRSSKGTRRTDA
jgi:hypothetical protein